MDKENINHSVQDQADTVTMTMAVFSQNFILCLAVSSLLCFLAGAVVDKIFWRATTSAKTVEEAVLPDKPPSKTPTQHEPAADTPTQTTSTTPTTTTATTSPVPTSVNYHFTRKCNYQCGFCFHTAKTSYVLPIEDAKRGLKMLKDAGMEKVNFSGGEPFIVERGRYLGEMVKYCKKDLQLPSVSIVSNGSLVREKWFKDYGEFLDILAISCDSFDSETNQKIGRQHGQKDHVQSLRKVQEWCAEYQVAFKINTVVNTHNKHEDMSHNIMLLNPCRWKVFQCLVIDGENAGPEALRNAESFTITDEEFDSFLHRHKDVTCLVPESNELMRYSYLIVDEYMRFLDGGTKKASPSLLDVGVEAAIDTSKFDEVAFFKRGGKYVWSKADMKLDW